MPLSTDNQDFGKSDKENEKNTADNNTELSSDDLKGKKVDADPSTGEGKPAPQDQQ